MNYQAVIFDLDGTLIDTLQDLTNSVNYAMAHYGLPKHTASAVRQMVGNGNRMLMTRALPADKQPFLEEAFAMQRDYYQDHLLDFSRPYQGIVPTIDTLKSQGVKLAVLSNKLDHFTQPIINILFPAGTFDIVFGHREGLPLKPDPTSVLEIVQKLNLPPERIAYVGDTAIDMQTARNAGTFSIGVTWGFRDRPELEAHQADVIIDHPEQIPPIVIGV